MSKSQTSTSSISNNERVKKSISNRTPPASLSLATSTRLGNHNRNISESIMNMNVSSLANSSHLPSTTSPHTSPRHSSTTSVVSNSSITMSPSIIDNRSTMTNNSNNNNDDNTNMNMQLAEMMKEMKLLRETKKT